MMLRTVAALALNAGAGSAMPQLAPDAIESAAQRILAFNASVPVGIVNGRTTEDGEWEGTVMVIGSSGECEDDGLCTGMFIHPVGRFVGLLYL